jgi:hypothetical protein
MVNMILALIGVTIITLGTWLSGRLWTQYDKEVIEVKKKKSLIYLCIIIFPLLLLGAYLSTYNWNAYFREQERDKQKKVLAQALEVENTLNKITCLELFNNKKDELRGSSEISIPKFQTTVLTSAIGGALFNDKKDLKLNIAMLELYTKVDEANNRITIAQGIITQRMLLQPDANITYGDFIKGWPILNVLATNIDNLETVLYSYYGVCRADSFLYPDEINGIKNK